MNEGHRGAGQRLPKKLRGKTDFRFFGDSVAIQTAFGALVEIKEAIKSLTFFGSLWLRRQGPTRAPLSSHGYSCLGLPPTGDGNTGWL
jgi:hypothetical protein